MADKSLAEVAEAVVSSWGPETMYATAEPTREPRARSRGQCGTTALVLQDWLSGALIVADVFRDGEHVGVHYGNRLPESGVEVDLTRDQFLPNEALGAGRELERPPDTAWKYHPGYGPYLVLKQRVASWLVVPGPVQVDGHDPLPEGSVTMSRRPSVAVGRNTARTIERGMGKRASNGTVPLTTSE